MLERHRTDPGLYVTDVSKGIPRIAMSNRASSCSKHKVYGRCEKLRGPENGRCACSPYFSSQVGSFPPTEISRADANRLVNIAIAAAKPSSIVVMAAVRDRNTAGLPSHSWIKWLTFQNTRQEEPNVHSQSEVPPEFMTTIIISLSSHQLSEEIRSASAAGSELSHSGACRFPFVQPE